MPTTLARSLREAVAFLKHTGVIKRNEEIVNATGASSSMLSQILSGRKNPPEEFLRKFQETYKLNLDDPMTYTDLSRFKTEALPGDLSVASYMETYQSMKRLLLAKEEHIEALSVMFGQQAKTILNLKRQVRILTETFLKYEAAVLQAHIQQQGNPEVMIDGEWNEGNAAGAAMLRFFTEAGILDLMREPVSFADWGKEGDVPDSNRP